VTLGARLVILAGLVLAAAPGRAQAPVATESGRLSVSGEYLLWWTKDSPAPTPLVSTGPLGDPRSRVLLGGQDIDTGEHHGARVTIGYRLTDDRRWGIEGSHLFLPRTSTRRSVSAPGTVGSQELSIPFFDVTRPGESTTGLAVPGRFAGTATERLTSRLGGDEVNGILTLTATERWGLDLLAGVRHLGLSERYHFDTNTPGVPPQPVDVFETRDAFDADNRFYGGQVGLRGRYALGRWQVSGGAKVALGAMREKVEIDGVLVTNDFNGFGTPQAFPGGYFAQPTNMGTHRRDVFAVVPEATISVGYQVTSWALVFVGYTILYASDVVRPGDHVDRGINPSQSASFTGTQPSPLVGPARPAFRFSGSDFWAQGLSVGLAVRF
jgi:hypothetical protein